MREMKILGKTYEKPEDIPAVVAFAVAINAFSDSYVGKSGTEYQ